MNRGIKTVYYDEELQIEAFRFEGITQAFPNHFHEYYVIGFIENGKRLLSCREKDYIVERGAVILLNPGDSHACVPYGEDELDYRGFNISKEVMKTLAKEITGKEELPGFSQHVILDEEFGSSLLALHQMVMDGARGFNKEELLLLLICALIDHCGQPFEDCIPECREEIEKVCAFIEEHYAEHMDLAQLCSCAGLSSSTLLRSFTKSKGVTPYRYLEIVRINAAKRFLEQGVTPIETAMRTGFSDQSHFTNFFRMFIGVSPGTYREIFLEKNKAAVTGGTTNGE